MTTTKTTIADLEAKAQAARDRHERADHAAAEARRQEQDARARRLDAYDRDVLDGYDDEALGQQVRDAQRALDRAVADDPLGAAWVALKVAQRRRAHFSTEAAAAAARLGDPRTITTRVADSAVFEELGRSVDRVADALHADELDARDDARTTAGER